MNRNFSRGGHFALSFTARRIRPRAGCRNRLESLEPRMLLAADLVAQWRAEDLLPDTDAGAVVGDWPDAVGGRVAFIEGQPLFAPGMAGGRAAVRFDPSDGRDGFEVRPQGNPLSGLIDFTVAVSFVTSSTQLVGGQQEWFRNTGLVDASTLGLSSDWGVTINAEGRVSAGVSGGFAAPPATIYSSVAGLNDGQMHTVVFVRQGTSLSLYVDDASPDQLAGVPAVPLGPNGFSIGQLATKSNPLAGAIAEVRLYNGAMNDSEAASTVADLTRFYVNRLPVANGDRYAIAEDAFALIVPAAQGVLANDTDAEGDALTAHLISEPAHGTLVLNADGSFIYDSDRDFFGQDSFVYSAHDRSDSEPATVIIDVAPVYDAAAAMADEYRSLPTEVLVVNAASGVLANDSNPDRTALRVELVNDVTAGDLELNADGSFRFDPQGFAGSTSFTYRIDDGTNNTGPATVTLILNTPPVAQADQYVIEEDETASHGRSSGVLANDMDADGDGLVAALTMPPAHGTLQLQPDGSFVYVPEPNFSGSDEFRYTVSDGAEASSETVVRIQVAAVNDVPQTAPESYIALPNRRLEIPVEHGVLTNDDDIDGPGALRAELAENASHGSITLHPDGSFVYQPNPGFTGIDSFRYRAGDSIALSEPTLVQVRVDPEPIRISEFMAANVDSLATRTRATSDENFPRGQAEPYDWIEVQNPFDSPIHIGGLYLTDDADELTKWQIPPGTTIPAGGEWVVFASGLNITDPLLDETGRLHTNFTLSSEGEYLAITAPGNLALFRYDGYPPQRADVSYGVDQAGRTGYFLQPDPGADNAQEARAAVADTQFSVARGFYRSPQSVAISTATPGAEVYYTLDGSEPDAGNPSALRYTQPVAVTTTTTIRAAAFREGLLPSSVETQTYIFVDDVVKQGNSPQGYPSTWKNLTGNGSLPADYEMDPEITENPRYRDIMDDALLQVPTISIVTSIDNLFDRDTGIYQNPMQSGIAWERSASVELIHPDGTVGFQVDAGLRIQGGASREPEKSPKHSFRLLFKDIYGSSKLAYPLFGAEAADEFDTIILRAGFNQSYLHHNTFLGDNRGRAQYVRDQWAKDTQLAMGWPSPHNSYAHLYINGMYWGLYNPTERPTDDFGAQYFGGEKEEYDVYNSGELLDGTSDAWNRLWQLAGADLSDDANYAALAEILDIDAYIDYMLINHYGANQDWDDHNWYALRRRTDDGKWYFYMWDSEFLFIGENDNALRVSDGPRFPARLMRELTDNAEFRIRLADRIQRHMYNDGALTPEKVIARWNVRSDQITDAIVAESARWGDYRRDVDPRSFPSGGPFELLERDVQWVAERERLLTRYFPQRTQTVIEQYRRADLFPSIEAPQFSQRGGQIGSETDLSLLAAEGLTIYYTLDGSDPRAPGGAVEESALVYNDPIRIDASTTIRTRAQSLDGEWSALDEAAFLVDVVPASAASLRISEINYHPASPSPAEIAAGFNNDDDFEFVEVMNVSQQVIDLSEVRFERTIVGGETVGIAFDFASGDILRLSPGERALVVEDRDAFEFRYGGALPIAGVWSGGLNNSGELLTLVAGDGVIHQFSYSDRWQRLTDGDGYTLEHIDPASDDLDGWALATSWRASRQLGGSPGNRVPDAVPGDSNHDGRFNSSDLVLVFQAGEYEDAIRGNSTFEEGDWNGDGDFTTADLVYVFQFGSYTAEAIAPRRSPNAAAVDSIFERAADEHAQKAFARNGSLGIGTTGEDYDDWSSTIFGP